MLATGISADAKLNAISQHAARLSLRLPTEPCVKMVCSLWLLVSSEPEELNAMDTVAKAITLLRTRDEFNVFRKRLPDPALWVEAPPENPCEYM